MELSNYVKYVHGLVDRMTPMLEEVTKSSPFQVASNQLNWSKSKLKQGLRQDGKNPSVRTSVYEPTARNVPF